MYFLNERYQRLHEAFVAESSAPQADFIFEKDKIFAYLNLDNEELKLYERFFARFAAHAAVGTGDYLQAIRPRCPRAGGQERRQRIPPALPREVARLRAFFFATQPPICSSSTPLKSISSGAWTCTAPAAAGRAGEGHAILLPLGTLDPQRGFPRAHPAT
jgi:hypothetical protein